MLVGDKSGFDSSFIYTFYDLCLNPSEQTAIYSNLFHSSPSEAN